MVEHRPQTNADDSTTEVTEHLAHRPSWDCLVCGKPWPCDTAREAFMATMTRVERAMLMWAYLEDAVMDVRGMPMDEVFARFISWTR